MSGTKWFAEAMRDLVDQMISVEERSVLKVTDLRKQILILASASSTAARAVASP